MAKLSKRIPAIRMTITAIFPLAGGLKDAAKHTEATAKVEAALKDAGFHEIDTSRQIVSNMDRPDASTSTTASSGSGDGKQGSDGGDKAGAGKPGAKA